MGRGNRMIYNSFCGENISTIGMGCMRLPLSSEDSTDIDTAQVDEMVDWAIEHGVNYFDTHGDTTTDARKL